MILNAYTLFDNKALVYSPPFFQNTDGAAVRMLGDLVEDNNTQVGRHPGDFVLYCIGTFSDANASLEPTAPLRHVIDAVALVKIKGQGRLFGDPIKAAPDTLSSAVTAAK